MVFSVTGSGDSEGLDMGSGKATEEEAGGDQNATDSAVDRAFADAANRADPVPAAVVDAAKQAYEHEPTDSVLDRAFADAANRADPVPAAVVDAAKLAYEQRLPTSSVSTDGSARARGTKTSTPA